MSLPAWIVEPVAPGPSMRMPDWDTRERLPVWLVEYLGGDGDYAVTEIEARDRDGAEQTLVDQLAGTSAWACGQLRILGVELRLPHPDHPSYAATVAALAARQRSPQ